MKQSFILLIALIFSVDSGSAQNHELLGTVRSLGGETLANAHILDLNSRSGTATDEFGKFVLTVSDSGTTLRVSHLGFRPELVKISAREPYYQDQLIQRADITLTRESTLLSSVQIRPAEKTVLDGRRGVVLRDFSFAGGNNLLLMAEDGIRHLVWCNEQWEEISRLQVGKLGYKLFDDCLGNVHLFGEDSVYQVGFGPGRLELTHAAETSYFLEQIAHCSASSDSHIFFSSYQKAGQEVFHYGLHRKTKEGTILQQVYDHVGLRDINDYFDNISRQRFFGNRFRAAQSTFAYERLETQRQNLCFNDPVRTSDMMAQQPCVDMVSYNRFRNAIRNTYSRHNFSSFGGAWEPGFGGSQTVYFESVERRQLEQQSALLETWSPSPRDRGWLNLISQPTYSPMFELRDSIFVFDHVLGVCYVHDKTGIQARTIPIEHHEIKGWRNLLVPDANGERLYAHVKERNKVYLMEIDLDDGKILRSALLKDARLVEQLKVKDGYAYYLKEYRDISMSDRMMKVKL